jgi:1-acyl-sn-glycerol-3-phosphate acyltransferase
LLRKLTATIRGVVVLLVIGASTVTLSLVLFLFAIGKFLAPGGRWRDAFRAIMARLVEAWIAVNGWVLPWPPGRHWDVRLPSELTRRGSYLVSCNHQSWVDILVLQRCFNRRLPLLVFFIKQELIWVPVLGVAWWALDFPFMRRASREKQARRPSLRGRDLESARRACEKLRGIPVAMMSFPEGTRFHPRKREQTGSPYRNLLAPKIGGLGQVLYAMGDRLDALIDVTIIYPGTTRAPTFWDLASGQLPEIVVRAERRDIPPDLLGRDFRKDRAFRGELESWVGSIWREKDELISKEMGGRGEGS